MITLAIAIFMFLLVYYIRKRTTFVEVCSLKKTKNAVMMRIYSAFVLASLCLLLLGYAKISIYVSILMVVTWTLHNILCNICNSPACKTCIAVNLKKKNIFDKMIYWILKNTVKITEKK